MILYRNLRPLIMSHITLNDEHSTSADVKQPPQPTYYMKQHFLSQVRNNIQLPFPSSTYYEFSRKIIYVNNYQSCNICGNS